MSPPTILPLESPARVAPRGSAVRGLWRLADPKISLASFSSLFLGACAAAIGGPLDVSWLAVTVLGIFLIEVGKNASGEIFDYASDSGVRDEDRSPFSGGKRVLVDGLLTRNQAGAIAAAGFLGGIAVGIAIAVAREPRVLWIGAGGVACAFFYNAGPLKLAYRGLGELAVAVCYGPLIFAGTVLVQRHALPWNVLAVSLPLGLLIAAFLWTCEFPDFLADRSAGKRNLVVRIGRPRAARLFSLLIGLTAVGVALLPLAGVSRGVLFGLIFIAPAFAAASILLRDPETTRRIIPAQAFALVSFLAYAAAAGMGMLIVR